MKKKKKRRKIEEKNWDDNWGKINEQIKSHVSIIT